MPGIETKLGTTPEEQHAINQMVTETERGKTAVETKSEGEVTWETVLKLENKPKWQKFLELKEHTMLYQTVADALKRFEASGNTSEAKLQTFLCHENTYAAYKHVIQLVKEYEKFQLK